MRRTRRTWAALFLGAMGAALLAGCGGTPEEAIRDLALTATAVAPTSAPASRPAFVATPAAPRTGSAAAMSGSAVAGSAKPGSTAPALAAAPTGGATPNRPATATVAATTTSSNSTPANGTPLTSVNRGATATGDGPRLSPVAVAPLFTDVSGRYSFRVPSKWRGQKSANTAVEIEVVSDTPTACLRTVSQTTAAPVTLDGATSVIVNSLRKTVGSFEEAPGGTREAMIGGQRAKRIEYYGTDHGTRLRYVTYVIVYDQKLVVSLFFIAQPGDLDEVLMQGAVVLNTFTFA